RRMIAHVQNDLAGLHVLSGHFHARHGGVYDDVRRLRIVTDPLVHGPEQIGPARSQRGLCHGYARISCSIRERLWRNAGREKMRFAYREMDGACARSISHAARRQSIGAIEASTSENSSERK